MHSDFWGWACDTRCLLRNSYNVSPFTVSKEELEDLFADGLEPLEAAVYIFGKRTNKT